MKIYKKGAIDNLNQNISHAVTSENIKQVHP